MPSTLSTLRETLYSKTWSFPYNCYEVGHSWNPNCTEASLELALIALQRAIMIYTPLYVFTQLGIQRKCDKESFWETIKSILTSTAFLTFNVYSGLSLSCFFRNTNERYYYRIQLLLPAFISAYFSLLIERPSRRPALAFYLANMSTEIAFKFVVKNGYFRPLPHGETILFVIGMACWLRFVRMNGFGHDPVSTAMKFLVGSQEAKSRARKTKSANVIKNVGQKSCNLTNCSSDNTISLSDKQHGTDVMANISRPKPSSLAILDANTNKFFNMFFGAHETCPHGGTSCIYYTLSPVVTRFSWGYLARATMNLVSSYRLLLNNPGRAFVQSLTNKNCIRIGLFLSIFVGASRSLHCILRRCTGKQEVWHSAVAGAASGLSMLMAPKATLSTYVIWKCLEQYFFLAVENGTIKHAQGVICLVYAMSVNMLLYAFALEPSFVRPSYMKFIDELSGHRLHQANRMVLDIFSPHASQGYEEWFPDLDPKHMSREFKELIFNWMIQPS